jgi:hypothetical protein
MASLVYFFIERASVGALTRLLPIRATAFANVRSALRLSVVVSTAMEDGHEHRNRTVNGKR